MMGHRQVPFPRIVEISAARFCVFRTTKAYAEFIERIDKSIELKYLSFLGLVPKDYLSRAI
jgi:hypothetical protein